MPSGEPKASREPKACREPKASRESKTNKQNTQIAKNIMEEKHRMMDGKLAISERSFAAVIRSMVPGDMRISKEAIKILHRETELQTIHFFSKLAKVAETQGRIQPNESDAKIVRALYDL